MTYQQRLQPYIRPVGAGVLSCWPWWHSRAKFLPE